MHRPILALALIAALSGCIKGANDYNEGVKQFQAKNFDQAKTLFEKALAANPDFTEAWYNLGATKLHLAIKAAEADKKDEALKLFKSGHEDKKKALALMKQGKFVAYSEKGEQDRLLKECEGTVTSFDADTALGDEILYIKIKNTKAE